MTIGDELSLLELEVVLPRTLVSWTATGPWEEASFSSSRSVMININERRRRYIDRGGIVLVDN